MANTESSILFVSKDPDNQYNVKSLVEQMKCTLRSASSRARAFQTLSSADIDLVLADVEVLTPARFEFCYAFRKEKKYDKIPFVVVGDDTENSANCIAAFKAGADDFIQHPFHPDVFALRINRFLKKNLEEGKKAFLSVQIGPGELPGIIQYLEADIKTGKLNIKRKDDKLGILYLKEGRLVNAIAPFCDAMEAITEVLSWDSAQVTFVECELEESEIIFNQEATGSVMNCIVDVDEYREVQRAMPDNKAMLIATKLNLKPDVDPLQKSIYELALHGYSKEDILSTVKTTQRKGTMLLHSLLDQGYLTIDAPPFSSHTYTVYSAYRGSQIFLDRFNRIRKLLSEVKFPLARLPDNLPYGGKDFMAPAPKILIAGDNLDHVNLFVQSLSALSTHMSQSKPLILKHRKGIVSTRIYFSAKEIIDIQQLPPSFDKLIQYSLNEYLGETHAAIFLTSSQDKKTTAEVRQQIRLIWQRFKGVYYFVVPQVPGNNGLCEFHMDCTGCGYLLAVDMEMAGSMGECPVCKTSLTIPDCLDHLAHSLDLPNEVPIAQIRPDLMDYCRDLLLLLFDSVIQAHGTPPAKPPPMKKTQPTPTKDKHGSGIHSLERTQVREREAKSNIRLQIESEPIKDATEQFHQEQLKTSMFIDDELIPISDTEDESKINQGLIDKILSSDDDQFDIDDFIKSVRKK